MCRFFIFLACLIGVVPIVANAEDISTECEELQANLDPDKIIVIQGYMSGHVVIGEGRLYFYSAPAAECRTEVFIIPANNVDVVEEYENFSSVTYINPENGNMATGWVESNRLRPNGFGIAPEQ